jgi:hypothetical protein
MIKFPNTPGTAPTLATPVETQIGHASAALLRGDDADAADALICLVADVVQSTLQDEAGDATGDLAGYYLDGIAAPIRSYIEQERAYHDDIRADRELIAAAHEAGLPVGPSVDSGVLATGRTITIGAVDGDDFYLVNDGRGWLVVREFMAPDRSCCVKVTKEGRGGGQTPLTAAQALHWLRRTLNQRWDAMRAALRYAEPGIVHVLASAEDIATDGEQATLRAALQTITALYDRTNTDD